MAPERARAKKDPKAIDQKSGLRLSALSNYGKITPAEVSAAYVETKEEARKKKVRMTEVCPNEIRRDVLVALANKIKPDRLMDTINKLLTATYKDLNGNEVDDRRANEAGLRMYSLLYNTFKDKISEESEENTANAAEEELMKRLTESKSAYEALQNALARVKSVGAHQVVEAEIIK